MAVSDLFLTESTYDPRHAGGPEQDRAMFIDPHSVVAAGRNYQDRPARAVFQLTD